MAHAYEDAVAARHDAGLAHIATMPAPPDTLVRWAALMARRYGPTIAVWNAGKPQHAVESGTIDLSAYAKDWLHALLIVKYGEATEHWPSVWSDDLVARAESWAAGQTPSGIVYPAVEA